MFRVESYLSGTPVVWGRFETLGAAKLEQDAVWKRGYYYCAIYQEPQTVPFKFE